MDSAKSVGEIFKRAGEAYNKLGDRVLLLHPAAQELIAIEQKQQVNKTDRTSSFPRHLFRQSSRLGVLMLT